MNTSVICTGDESIKRTVGMHRQRGHQHSRLQHRFSAFLPPLCLTLVLLQVLGPHDSFVPSQGSSYSLR